MLTGHRVSTYACHGQGGEVKVNGGEVDAVSHQTHTYIFCVLRSKQNYTNSATCWIMNRSGSTTRGFEQFEYSLCEH